MPTCTNQTGYNNAYAAAASKKTLYQSIQSSRKTARDIWVANGSIPPDPYPSPTYGQYLTAAECSEFTWWLFYYFLSRVPSGAENAIHANGIWQYGITLDAKFAEFAECAECWNLWGCH